MRTISEVIRLYDSVFREKKDELQSHTISSDGTEWIVEGCPLDTIENKKRYLNAFIEKMILIKDLLDFIGEDSSRMFDEYALLIDKNMVFLAKKTQQKIILIHHIESIVEKSAMIEQIDIGKCSMVCHYFRRRFDEFERAQFYLEGSLSEKSKKLIDAQVIKPDIRVTQNFYYDMLFEGMKCYHDLISAITREPLTTEPEKGQGQFEIEKLKHNSTAPQ